MLSTIHHCHHVSTAIHATHQAAHLATHATHQGALPASLWGYLKYSQYHNGVPHCILVPKIQSKINISQLNYVHVLIQLLHV